MGIPDPPKFRFTVTCVQCNRQFDTNNIENSECPFCYVESVGALVLWPAKEEELPAVQDATEATDIDDLMADWKSLSKI